MSSLQTALIIFLCMLGGLFLGFHLRTRLPLFHLKGDSKDVMITATGMMATLVALIIGLLLSSAKDSFDEASARLIDGGAKAITLDYLLSLYGTETKAARDTLRIGTASAIERIWHSTSLQQLDSVLSDKTNAMADVYQKIHELSPQNDSQKKLKNEALDISKDLLQSRWMLVEQTQEKLPAAFLVVLTFWLALLFVHFGLLGPLNRTTASALTISALSLSSAIFFILELNNPLQGLIKIPIAPLEKTLQIIGK